MADFLSNPKKAIIALGSNRSNRSNRSNLNNASNCSSSGDSNRQKHNRGDCVEILCKVIARIDSSDITVLRQSAFIESVYQGQGERQPNYINAVILVETVLPPLDLLHYLQSIEVEFGRPAPPRISGEPRTIDLDIVDYEGVVMQTPELTLPHPRARERGFVMGPLREIARDYIFADEVDSA